MTTGISDSSPQRLGNSHAHAPVRRSVYGRPRLLTAAQIVRILAWHDARVTLKQLSAELRVSTSTIVHVIKTRGTHYKQAAPEERLASLQAHRARRRQLRAANLL
jgi:transcriptional antiterminator